MSDLFLFLCGLTIGIIASLFVSMLAMFREWDNRRKLESKVDRLWKHLSCGQGILGCTAGPRCDWDHK